MIRQGVIQDKKEAAVLIYDAIHEIAHALTGEEEREKVLRQLERYYIQDINRLSYRNCFIKEEDGVAVGIIVLYPGKDAATLDEPIKEHLRKLGNQNPVLDKEADYVDLYIDTLSVNPLYSGRGIGTELIKAAISFAKEQGIPSVSLNVEQNNTSAHRLYDRLGFIYKKTIKINGDHYFYLVRQLKEAPLSV